MTPKVEGRSSPSQGSMTPKVETPRSPASLPLTYSVGKESVWSPTLGRNYCEILKEEVPDEFTRVKLNLSLFESYDEFDREFPMWIPEPVTSQMRSIYRAAACYQYFCYYAFREGVEVENELEFCTRERTIHHFDKDAYNASSKNLSPSSIASAKEVLSFLQAPPEQGCLEETLAHDMTDLEEEGSQWELDVLRAFVSDLDTRLREGVLCGMQIEETRARLVKKLEVDCGIGTHSLFIQTVAKVIRVVARLGEDVEFTGPERVAVALAPTLRLFRNQFLVDLFPEGFTDPRQSTKWQKTLVENGQAMAKTLQENIERCSRFTSQVVGEGAVTVKALPVGGGQEASKKGQDFGQLAEVWETVKHGFLKMMLE